MPISNSIEHWRSWPFTGHLHSTCLLCICILWLFFTYVIHWVNCLQSFLLSTLFYMLVMILQSPGHVQHFLDCCGPKTFWGAEGVVRHSSWGDMNEHLLTLDRELMIDQYGKPMSFIGVAYCNTGTESLKDNCIINVHLIGGSSQKLNLEPTR